MNNIKRIIIILIAVFCVAYSEILYNKNSDYYNFNNSKLNSNKFVIGCIGAGLFANFIMVLNHLLWCDQNNKIPVVNWSNYSYYYNNSGYNGSKDVWQYYFEPVSNLDYNLNDKIAKSPLDHNGTLIPVIQTDINLFEKWLQSLKPINNIIKKYIKIKQNIRNKIDNFYNEKMRGKVTIGIHLRGTDKKMEIKQTDPLLIIQEANKFTNCQYLVATDEVQLLELAKKHLKGDVIFYNSHRTNSGVPLHKGIDFFKPLVGEEVLIETQLLSKCSHLIHTISNVSLCCYYFNPNLKGTLFVQDKKKYINHIAKAMPKKRKM